METMTKHIFHFLLLETTILQLRLVYLVNQEGSSQTNIEILFDIYKDSQYFTRINNSLFCITFIKFQLIFPLITGRDLYANCPVAFVFVPSIEANI